MKKILITITIVAVLGILVSVGFFGYTKYQEVELEKDRLQKQVDTDNNSDKENNNNMDDSNHENQISDEENSSTQENQNIQNQSTNEKTGSSLNNQKVVTRDNVFDYLIAEINSKPGNDSNKIIFQEPQYKGGYWLVPANNKSGMGSYSFKVYDNGKVDLE
ncbi:hypothetical protein J3T65_09870 [Staphylococcus simiae]|uniref:hypothetical protein n=1 Tax=Staphylococcus simiae TaxID=308354 RepID=UPI001A9861B8|nr:hypothetical protein [Staphylococcus simiae]MBO1198291.1 hypothetical protein [Staphylococcus simiae]MBO1201974.1 hypothetical protein [Staphylococcus simiae]MBO1204194.1 hypothetical protein [Staphylococcus simiae]MBO1210283.1 hypothetical protein [Staphylococcus simiae]MBO1230428.1 hypothetical protein [Staphylococcus simiae]